VIVNASFEHEGWHHVCDSATHAANDMTDPVIALAEVRFPAGDAGRKAIINPDARRLQILRWDLTVMIPAVYDKARSN